MTRRTRTALKRCDDLFSQLVRARGKCENDCGHPIDLYNPLQCAHGFSRSYKVIRCDLRNAFCLCKRCHLHFTWRPLEWDDWLRSRMGSDTYEFLRREALTHRKMDWDVELERLRMLERLST